jgi:hypothetical protein
MGAAKLLKQKNHGYADGLSTPSALERSLSDNSLKRIVSGAATRL